MGVLKAFLCPAPIDDTKTVVISKRFVGEDGNPVPFEIKAITQEQNQVLMRKHTRAKMVNGQKVEIFDNVSYTDDLIVSCTVQPDFTDAEMCKAYGCVDPASVPAKMLRAGEYTELVRQIMSYNGFDPNSQLKDEEEAKN